MLNKSFNLDAQLNKDCIYISDLNLCRVLLNKDANYLWIILVPQIINISEIFELKQNQQQILWSEVNFVAQILKNNFNADKINIAALGNQVAQLHIHVIGRYKNDIAWPQPIWGKFPTKTYQNDDLAKLITKLQKELKVCLV